MAKKIEKTNWFSSFNLIGVPKINDYTFKIDEKSTKSNWIYNSLNLGIDCGEKFGTVYCECMGGYSAEQAGVIYAHGKKDDGSDDFETQIQVAWEDRFNENVLELIGDLCFMTVGLEKTDKGNTFYKKFLSPYDAIAYIKEHLTEDIVVNVRGNLKYSEYNDATQVRKNITSIVLSKVDDSSKYAAHFVQSILIDKDSATLKPQGIDKDKGVMYVDARVLDYLKEKNGVEIKGQYPYDKQFEFSMNFDNEKQCKAIMNKVFNVKKGITQFTFEGDFIEGGATVKATMDDVPDDIKDLIECGIFTEEEALKRCSSSGNREQRMVLRKPFTRRVEETTVLQRFDERYTEDDLTIDFNNSYVSVPEKVEGTESSDVNNDDDELSWLNNL